MSQTSTKSMHEGHDPSDPRVELIEDIAKCVCLQCSDGELRWRDAEDGHFYHADDDYGEAADCDASQYLSAALGLGVPLYTGAELEFDEDAA